MVDAELSGRRGVSLNHIVDADGAASIKPSARSPEPYSPMLAR